MSHVYYNSQWVRAQQDLTDMLVIEQPKDPAKPEKDTVAALQKLAIMYVKYIQIFRNLEQCYDQITHPQKCRLIRHVLDGTMGRMLEIKQEMVNLDLLEYQYFDDILTDMKLTPADIEIPIPHYFIAESSKVLKEREKMMNTVLGQLQPIHDEIAEESTMTTDEAIRLIQVHERARQGRLRAKFMKDIRLQEERERQAQIRGLPKVSREDAAIRIQKIWKGFHQRKLVKEMRAKELEFLGMAPSPQPVSQKHSLIGQAKKTEEKRRLMQEQYEKDYKEALFSIKERLGETEGPDMKEQMQDQIRQWFIEVRDATGKFPDYPSVDEGGSVAIFKKREIVEESADDTKGKGKKGKKGKKKGKEKGKKKGKKGKKGKGDDEEEPGFKMAPSNFVPTINEGVETYGTTWLGRDESVNPQQRHDAELIKDKKRVEIEAEIRVHVDELMREELKNLKLAIEKDKGKGKKGKKKGKKKKGKKGKGKKKKGEKDLTPDRTIESLYEELVREGVILKHPKVKLSDYLGDFSYLATTLRQIPRDPNSTDKNAEKIEPMPSLADVRRLVTEHCILPLGSQAVHEKAPHIKSLMIAGPRGTGKKTLVHAICTETGAIMFDLSPDNLIGKYPGKAGLNMILHMVFKVAKAWPPGVVFIGDCHRTFMKKVPKTDKAEPKKFKKVLPKLLKTMKPDDRVMFIGVTKSPFDADVKGLCGMYQRTIMVPRPDYASRVMLWKSLLLQSGAHNVENLDINSLAKVSDGYTPGHINTAITQVLTERRIQQLRRRPLGSSEFIPFLAKIDPIYREEEEAYKAWFEKTPLGRKRAKAIKAAQGDDDGGGKKGKGKGKGKKKGKKKK